MFLDSSRFPFVANVESQWPTIRREFESLDSEHLMQWPETEIYQGSWDVLALYALGEKFEANCALCPETVKVIESIPGMTSAGFSALAAGAVVRPHVGYTSAVLRCHLGLIVPEGCALQVGEDIRSWEEGKCLIFDDTVLHSAWNRSVRQRVVLLLDFQKPDAVFDPLASPDALAAVQQLRDEA